VRCTRHINQSNTFSHVLEYVSYIGGTTSERALQNHKTRAGSLFTERTLGTWLSRRRAHRLGALPPHRPPSPLLGYSAMDTELLSPRQQPWGTGSTLATASSSRSGFRPPPEGAASSSSPRRMSPRAERAAQASVELEYAMRSDPFNKHAFLSTAVARSPCFRPARAMEGGMGSPWSPSARPGGAAGRSPPGREFIIGLHQGAQFDSPIGQAANRSAAADTLFKKLIGTSSPRPTLVVHLELDMDAKRAANVIGAHIRG
jgi:hypothetical protein